MISVNMMANMQPHWLADVQTISRVASAPEDAPQNRQCGEGAGKPQSEHRVPRGQELVMEVGHLQHSGLGSVSCGLDQSAAAPGCLVLPLCAHHAAQRVEAQV